jgi:hypothetical protein
MRKSTALEIAYRQAQARQGFIAWDLARYESLMVLDDENLAASLGLKPDDLVRLGLCGTPRRDTHFAHDLLTIGARVGVPAIPLANMLRTVDGILALEQLPSSSEQSVLLAARDRWEEVVRPQLPPAGVDPTPKWLIDAVEAFWNESPPPKDYPRDLELPILLNLPLGIVEIADLSVQQLSEWLGRFDIEILSAVQDRPLRGCLIAFSGAGLIIVDADDSPAERRETLAHEAGHFISDYLLPRRRIEGTAPELLEVVDGLRTAAEADRLQAVLARVQLGMHVTLIERTPGGGFVSDESDLAEESAARLAWEILAPANEVRMALETAMNAEIKALLQSHFGLSPSVAHEYGNYLAKSLQTGRRIEDWLGLDGRE